MVFKNQDESTLTVFRVQNLAKFDTRLAIEHKMRPYHLTESTIYREKTALSSRGGSKQTTPIGPVVGFTRSCISWVLC